MRVLLRGRRKQTHQRASTSRGRREWKQEQSDQGAAGEGAEPTTGEGTGREVVGEGC